MKSLRTAKELCTGCSICEMMCSLSHTGAVNPARARVRVTLTENDVCYPVVCRQCEKPECATACPEEAIQRDEKSGAVVIDREKCTSCLLCVDACPFDEIFVGPDNEVLKCDLCGGQPQCVKFCCPRPSSKSATEESCLQYEQMNPAEKEERQ